MADQTPLWFTRGGLFENDNHKLPYLRHLLFKFQSYDQNSGRSQPRNGQSKRSNLYEL